VTNYVTNRLPWQHAGRNLAVGGLSLAAHQERQVSSAVAARVKTGLRYPVAYAVWTCTANAVWQNLNGIPVRPLPRWWNRQDAHD